MMKVLKSVFYLILSLSLLAIEGCSPMSKEKPVENKKTVVSNCNPKVSAFTLVELFSSESCYDCPAAEEILNKLVISGQGDSNLIFVATHVDYWNDLIDGKDACEGNWNDPYSNSFFTSRQFEYGKQLNVRPVTPQFVINGRYVVNGADNDSLKQKMKLAYLDTAMFGLCLSIDSATDLTKRKLVVNYEVERAANLPVEFRGKVSPQVMIYLVEQNVVSIPTKGENCNKELHHMNVARAFNGHTIYGKTTSGSVEVIMPEKINLSNAYVVGFVQNLRDLKIMGASKGFKLQQ